MDIQLLDKKLQTSWSSWTVSRSLSSPALLDDLRNNFHKFEKKIKMRLLLSLLSIDPVKKIECTQAMKRLLKSASEEDQGQLSEQWVTITAGLVHNRLFGQDGISDQIETIAFSRINDTADNAVKKLHEICNSSTSISDSTFYFQPLEFRYLNSFLACNITKESTTNPHFSYVGTKPDFIGREIKQKDELLAEKKKQGPSLGRIRDSNLNNSSNSLSTQSEQNARKQQSNLSSSSYLSKQLIKTTSKVLSLEQLKMRAPSKHEDSFSGKKKQSAFDVKDSSPSSKKVKNGKDGKDITQEELGIESLPSVVNMDIDKPKLDDNKKEVPLIEGSSFEPPLSIQTTIQDSKLLSESDIKYIKEFFYENWMSLYPPTTPSKKIKFQILEAVDYRNDDEKTFIETYYIELNYQDHSWRKVSAIYIIYYIFYLFL
jgi:hypothetical protein